MLIKELIAKLAQYNPNSLVVLSQDEEGNEYRKVTDLYTGTYDEGEVYIKTPYTVETGSEDCVVLF